MEAVVEDLSRLAEPVCAGVHQRPVFHVLIALADDRIDGEQLAVDIAAALAQEGIAVLEVLPDGCERIVPDAV